MSTKNILRRQLSLFTIVVATGVLLSGCYNPTIGDSDFESPEFSVSVDSTEVRSANTKTEGSVTNESSDLSVRFVQVRVAWQNESDETIDTDSTYAVGSEWLHPGESSLFTAYTDETDNVSTATAEVYDYDYDY